MSTRGTGTGESARVYVGPAGWSYDDWKGIVYPPDMPRSLHALEFLSQYFDTVEVNAFELKHGLGEKVGAIPESLIEKYPRLKELNSS